MNLSTRVLRRARRPAIGVSLTASSLQQCYLAGLCPQARYWRGGNRVSGVDAPSPQRGPRRPWPPTARTAAAIIAAVALALPAAACSGNPPSTGSGSSSTADGSSSKLLAFARCMRSHGVPSFPDPSGSGFDKATLSRLAGGNSQYQTANQTCGHLLPNGGRRTAAEVQQEWSGMLNYARCMRSHGVPNWPDPTPYPPYPNEPTFMLPGSIQPTPPILSKMHVCLRLVPMNYAVGHIDNNNWEAAQQAMAGQ